MKKFTGFTVLVNVHYDYTHSTLEVLDVYLDICVCLLPDILVGCNEARFYEHD